MELPIISTRSDSLDHDFSNTWGIILSSTETRARPLADALFREYWAEAVSTERRYNQILCRYTDMFEYVTSPRGSVGWDLGGENTTYRQFFNGWLPISYHGHVTDAMCPTTIASMMLPLSMFGLTGCRLGRPASTPELRSAATQRLGWDEVHLSAPCVLCSDWERLWCCDGPAGVFSPFRAMKVSC